MQDYLMISAGIVAGVVIVMGTIYLVYRRGIAIFLTAMQMAGVASTAIAAFILGHEGLDLPRLGIAFVIMVPIMVVVVTMTSRRVIGPVKQMASAAGGIARGDVEQRVDVRRRDELGEMANAFQQMVDYLRAMAASANHLAQGNLAVEVTPRSEEDVLGNAFRQMIANLRDMVDEFLNSVTPVPSN